MLEFEPELMTVASTPSAVIRPLLLPEFITVAVPRAMARAAMSVLLAPGIDRCGVTAAGRQRQKAVGGSGIGGRSILVRAVRVLTNWDVTVPALLQAISVAVVVQANCADAGEFSNSTNAAMILAQQTAAVHTPLQDCRKSPAQRLF